MNLKPFEIMRWESPEFPTLEILQRMMQREGLEATLVEFTGQSRSQEMMFEQSQVTVVVQGRLQFAFPGYGVVDVGPGDIVEINAGILYDVTVNGLQTALMLQALRD